MLAKFTSSIFFIIMTIPESKILFTLWKWYNSLKKYFLYIAWKIVKSKDYVLFS